MEIISTTKGPSIFDTIASYPTRWNYIPGTFRMLWMGFWVTLHAIWQNIFKSVKISKEIQKLIDESKNDRRHPKVAIITGGNAGIGLWTAKGLALAGYHVIIACRSQLKGEKAAGIIRKDTGNKQVFVEVLDLTNESSIRDFVKRFLSQNLPLHLLINNAGCLSPKYTPTDFGVEICFATNHLGHFLLTNLLLEKLKKSGLSRIINVSSHAAFASSSINYQIIREKNGYNELIAYSNSKYANILFTKELVRQLHGTQVKVHATHPGGVASNFYNQYPLQIILSKLLSFILLNNEEGSLAQLRAALSQEGSNTHGFWVFNGLWNSFDTIQMKKDMEADRLWEFSEKMTHLK